MWPGYTHIKGGVWRCVCKGAGGVPPSTADTGLYHVMRNVCMCARVAVAGEPGCGGGGGGAAGGRGR